MLINHFHPSIPIMGLILYSLIDSLVSIVSLMFVIFIIENVKGILSHSYLFNKFALITLSFSFMELGLKVNQGYFVIDGVLISS